VVVKLFKEMTSKVIWEREIIPVRENFDNPNVLKVIGAGFDFVGKSAGREKSGQYFTVTEFASHSDLFTLVN